MDLAFGSLLEENVAMFNLVTSFRKYQEICSTKQIASFFLIFYYNLMDQTTDPLSLLKKFQVSVNKKYNINTQKKWFY